jgi:oxygen-independent coproporphyrinogen III oxidase
MINSAQLLNKYNISVPRYTSYPTVPFWEDMPADEKWIEDFRKNFHQKNQSEGISLYLHLPFCESLCTYCGCNKKITTNHKDETTYITALLKEWRFYRSLMEEKPVIREIHLGGGTPTFFSARHLQQLLESIFETAIIHPEHEFSIEGHPNNTMECHLITLYQLGFRRISLGVQDFDPAVQYAINRLQPVENVQRVTSQARETGFTSVNFDLIYGLPFQTFAGMQKTIEETICLRPDRIAFYSYAHVPWKQRSQRLFDENDLPSPEVKMQLYQLARHQFGRAGYFDIGMDHFALRTDDLYKAWLNGSLHRNFMGYTNTHTSFLLGLGVSAISDTGTAYRQNQKELFAYYKSIEEGKLPIHRGYYLDGTDLSFKQYILQITCKGAVTFRQQDKDLLNQYAIPRLKEMETDGLVMLDTQSVHVTEAGRQYIRNICQAFDLKWQQSENKDGEKIFSKSV